VEGGQATLFVSPSGRSLLIDTGWPEHGGRDADRIVAAARQAGLTKIDAVIVTHFHEDHAGGVPQLLQRIPVGTFYVHGPNREMDHGATEEVYAAFKKSAARAGTRVVTVHPGEHLPLPGLDITVISSDGRLLPTALPGAGRLNPSCDATAIRPADQTENARSLGVLIRFGRLRILDLGDLTWDKERELMCPTNRVGGVDLLVVSHHGWFHSSSPALVDGVAPVVAVMDNGETKGGSVAALDTIRRSPNLAALWQLHYSDEGGAAHNTDPKYIANMDGPDAGYDIEVTAEREGAFTVRNGRTGMVEHYAARD
jgi:beta-lactamase superfamily II metal-dependent hydrolase